MEGQDFELPAEVASDDDMIRTALAPFFPEVAGAEMRRTVTVAADGQRTQTVQIVKRAGPKG
jgi:hypothetical protein